MERKTDSDLIIFINADLTKFNFIIFTISSLTNSSWITIYSSWTACSPRWSPKFNGLLSSSCPLCLCLWAPIRKSRLASWCKPCHLYYRLLWLTKLRSCPEGCQLAWVFSRSNWSDYSGRNYRFGWGLNHAASQLIYADDVCNCLRSIWDLPGSGQNFKCKGSVK